jgi:uncharacterized protein (UPF0332 family)
LTDENIRANVWIETERGDASLESAELLLAHGKLADAVSRAYYGAFHHARALLLTIGEEPVTHAGIERLLHRDLVRSGKLDADIAKLFGRLQKMRLDADYTSEFVFTARGAAEEVDAAKQFVDASRKILRSGGWLGLSGPADED